jgi:hypothetical protein
MDFADLYRNDYRNGQVFILEFQKLVKDHELSVGNNAKDTSVKDNNVGNDNVGNVKEEGSLKDTVGNVKDTLQDFNFGHPAMGNPTIPKHLASQEAQFYIGRISCDSLNEGVRLNLTSVILETSKEIGAGCRVKVSCIFDFRLTFLKWLLLELRSTSLRDRLFVY